MAEATVGCAFSGPHWGGPQPGENDTMKATNRTLKATFAPETRFDIVPVPAVPFRGTQETALERLKARLLREHLNAAPEPGLYGPIRRAANEAAALAWTTPYSLLVLPVLLEEKVAEARRRYYTQRRIWEQSREILKAVA